MIRLVVSDLDNTLLYKSQIAKRDLKTIHQLQAQGIEFAIASGRDIASIRPVMDPLDVHCSVICGNGAEYRDENDQIIMSCYMDKSVIRDVLGIFHQLNIPYMLYATDGFYTCYDPQWVHDEFAYRCHVAFNEPLSYFEENGIRGNMPCNHLQSIDDLDAFLNHPRQIIKVEAFHADPARVTPSHHFLDQIPGISYLSSFPDNVEVTDQYAQKGFILEKVIEVKGLSKEEVIVLGDGLNDLSLFTCFPYSFAPADSHPDILKNAYKVVSKCKDGGFSEAIEYAMTHL